MKILGYHIGQGIIVNSDGETQNLGSYLKYLTIPRKDTLRVLFSLDLSIGHLLKMLNCGTDKENQLLNTTRLTLESYDIRYIPNKFLSIKKNSSFAYYSDMGQYVSPSAEDIVTPSQVLANRAKVIGEHVYFILSALGCNPTSLNNPVKAYDESILNNKDIPVKSQIMSLLEEKRIINELSSSIIDKIMLHIKDKCG
jgi:hypothetical protein